MYIDIFFIGLGFYGIILAIGFLIVGSMKVIKPDIGSQIITRIYAAMQQEKFEGSTKRLNMDEIRTIHQEGTSTSTIYAFPFLEKELNKNQCKETEGKEKICEDTALLSGFSVDGEIRREKEVCTDTVLLSDIAISGEIVREDIVCPDTVLLSDLSIGGELKGEEVVCQETVELTDLSVSGNIIGDEVACPETELLSQTIDTVIIE